MKTAFKLYLVLLLSLSAIQAFGQNYRFKPVNNGLPTPFSKFVYDVENSVTDVYIGTEDGIFVAPTGGDIQWTDAGAPHTVQIRSIADNGVDRTYFGTLDGKVSSTKSTHWIGAMSETITGMVVAGNNLFVVDFGREVVRYNPSTSEWKEVYRASHNNNVVQKIATNSAGHIFVGQYGGVIRSTDGGDTWTKLISVSFPRSISSESQNVYVVESGGIFHSADNGTSWVKINSGLPNPDFIELVATSHDGSVFAIEWISGKSSVFRFAGTSWTKIWETTFRVLDIVAFGNYIFLGTYGDGVLMGDKTPTTDVSSPNPKVLPDGYVLAQNFPNPFNPTTTIKYQLAKPGHVRLSIYTSLGQEVRRLVDGNEAAAYHLFVWDGRDDAGNALPSGVYFYRLESGSFTAMKKMIMMK